VEDVVAELANMVGGNLKALIPAANKLSLPMITTGNDLSDLVGATKVHDLGFLVDGEPMRVVVAGRG
jgi:chemotaxis protein CheX